MTTTQPRPPHLPFTPTSPRLAQSSPAALLSSVSPSDPCLQPAASSAARASSISYFDLDSPFAPSSTIVSSGSSRSSPSPSTPRFPSTPRERTLSARRRASENSGSRPCAKADTTSFTWSSTSPAYETEPEAELDFDRPSPYLHYTPLKTTNAFRSMTAQTRSGAVTRRLLIGLVVLVSLVLLGTVGVLSSISHWLAFPDGAFLTERDVPWTGRDVITPVTSGARAGLKLGMRTGGLGSRQDWEEVDMDGDKVIDADDDLDDDLDDEELEEAWEETEDLLQEEAEDDGAPLEGFSPAPVEPLEGQYWLADDWDGRVKDVESWERLYNVTTRPGKTIPRLIHQTWKDDELPTKWRAAWKQCRSGMPDYEYMLWTDALSRNFIATHYPSFLPTFDGYRYPIQRADSIRYFILHHFGGVYMDLDIACRRRMDSLLQGDWEVVLPITKPVGVSNDLIFSSKGSDFMGMTIQALPAWDHSWVINYPTVMFSTGPMFLSAQYAAFTSATARLSAASGSRSQAPVRILPKSLYGKNAPPSSVPHAFFSHLYGSSWHDDDAGFIAALDKWGTSAMALAAMMVGLVTVRLVLRRKSRSAGSGAQEYKEYAYRLLGGAGRVEDSAPEFTASARAVACPMSAEGSSSSASSSSARSAMSSLFISEAGSSSSSPLLGPTSSRFSETSRSPSPSLEAADAHGFRSALRSAVRRAGVHFLAAPATLLSSRSGALSLRWLPSVPALLHSTSAFRSGRDLQTHSHGPGPGRGRTASSATRLPSSRSESKGFAGYESLEKGEGSGPER